MSRSFLVALAINLICGAGLIWAATGRLHVTVIYSGDSVTGIVGSATVTAPAEVHAGGQIGLFLQGADPHASVQWPVSPDSGAQPSSTPIAEWFYRLGAESGWTNVRVKDLTNDRVIYPSSAESSDGQDWRSRFGDWFHHPLGGMTTPRPGLASIGATTTDRFELDADVLRPRNAAGVLILSSDGLNGLLFYFRPEDRDVMWFRVTNGQWEGPIASAPFHSFKQSAVASVQDVLRLALGGYPGALGILIGALGLGALEARIWQMARYLNRSARPYDPLAEFAIGQAGAVSSAVIYATPGYPTRPDVEPSGSPDPGARRLEQGREDVGDPGHAGIPPPLETSDRRAGRLAPPASAVVANGRGDAGDDQAAIHWRGMIGSVSPTVGALLLAGAALASTLYVADVVLQRMPHVQDSVAYLFQAKTFALGRLWVPTPALPEFFQHEFIVMKDGRWFSKYPPGWPMLLTLGVLAGAPWAVDPICGALSIYVIYRLGAEIYRPRVGLVAAALGVVSPFFLFLSASMMAHGSGLLFCLLFAWGFWRAGRSSHPLLPAALCGAAFGVGFLIRPYTMIVIALPFGLVALVQLARRPADGIRRYLPAAVTATPFVTAFLAYNAYFTGNPFYPTQQLWWSFDTVGFGPGHGPWGFTPIDALNNTSRNLLELLEHTFGWPEFLTLSLALVPFVAGRFRAWDWLMGAAFVALIVGYGLWWADGIMYGPRFYFEGLGFFLLLTARGIEVTVERAQRIVSFSALARRFRIPLAWKGVSDVRANSGADAVRTPRIQPRIAPVLAYGFVALLVAFNFAYYFPGQWQLYHGYNYVNHSKLDAVERAGIHHAVVFADVGQSYEWWEYGMVFSANDPLLRGDVIFARDLGVAEDRKLMAEFPGRSFYRLSGTDLQPFDAERAP